MLPSTLRAIKKPFKAFTSSYNKQFWVMCASSLLFFASFNLVIPELPGYLTSLGGGEHKGLIIGIFTLTALLARPFSGRLADTIGRVPVMVFGVVVCVVIGFLYPILDFVVGFFILRFFHGLSTGFTPTGNAAYVADIVPPNRRGEAMGLVGFFNSLGMAAGPILGSTLLIAFDGEYKWLFWISSALAFLSVLVFIGLPETLQNKQKMSWNHLKVTWADVYEPRVVVPSVVMALTAFSFGVVLTIVPDLCTQLGLENKGLFFTVFTLSSLLMRLIAGRASDQWGRANMLFVSASVIIISMVVIGLAQNVNTLLIGAAIFGIALGINAPTIFAWTIDLSLEKFRGRAMATVYIALELGIGAGALISGYVYANQAERMPISFFVAAGLAFLAFLYLVVYKLKR
ncbi:MAG: MFS transporter [Bacteroidetes bacterium]|nr:MFS transporter [Bacteroidota bacterium]